MRRAPATAATLGILAVLAILAQYVRPPDPGQVYRYRSDEYGIAGHTALLLRNGDCLVLSRSESDIGRTDAAPRSERRLFMIAAAKGVRAGADDNGPYLIDERNGAIARPGSAIDAEILFNRDAGTLQEVLELGWLPHFRCGHGLAKIFSISRVHR